MRIRTVIIKALSIFELHKEIPRFTRERILKAKKRCYARITGKQYETSFFARPAERKALVAASIAIAVIAAGATLYYSAYFSKGTGAEQSPAYVTFFVGSVSIDRGGSPVLPAVKTVIRDGDVIRVAEKSCLVMQTPDGQVTRFEAGTEALVESVANVHDRKITIRQGKVLSLIGKLSKGDNYEVRTQNAYAAVRGTQFLTQYDGKKFVVAVSEGKVAVDGIASDDTPETIVEPTMSADRPEATGVTTLRTISTIEKLELIKLSGTPVVPELEKKNEDDIRNIFTEQKQEEKENKINSTIEDESGISRERMKEKYGRVDTLTLYSGRVLRGVIVERGKQFKVLTQSGPVMINAEEIQNTETVNK